MRRVALLECEDAEKWEGYTELLWKDALQQEGDTWVVFRACKGELPSPGEAAAFDAVIVGGSHYSAYEQHDWIQKLLNFLPVVAAQQRTRIYGCCFGCQILARALGGQVGKNPNGSFTLTIEQVWPTIELHQYRQFHTIMQQALAAISESTYSPSPAASATLLMPHGQTDRQPTDEATYSSPDSAAGTAAAATVEGAADDVKDCNAAAALGTPRASQARKSSSSSSSSATGDAAVPMAPGHGCFKLIESHGDQVLQLPPGAVLLASSATAVNELWCFGPNVLASQFHLELTEPLVLQKIWSTLKDRGVLTEHQAEDSRRVLEAADSNTGLFLQVVQHFLKHGVVDNAAAHLGSTSKAAMTGAGVGKAAPADNIAAVVATGNSSGQEAEAGPSDVLNPALQQQHEEQHQHKKQQQHHQELQAQINPVVPPVSTAVAPLSSAAAAAALAAASASDVNGCSSPSAASERSVATTTAASTASITPFSHIEHQRKQQARDVGLQDSSERMVRDAAAAFDLKMESYHLDFVALQQLNDAAAEQYSSTAEIATALGNFVADMGSRQAGIRDALAALPLLDRQLKQLEMTVGKLDKQSRDLEVRVAKMQSDKNSKGAGAGISAYNYLSASFGRASSSMAAAAAAGAGQCLGGANLPKE